MGLSLKWDEQFEVMIAKMKVVVNHLKNIIISISTALIYYNMYLIKKVYFGYSIVSISKKQEEMLKKIYEPVILRKMGLSEKFLRCVLYSRRTVLGIGLMFLRMIMDILALKLYVGHNRMESEVARMIKVNEKNEMLHYGYSTRVLEIDRE